MSSSDSSFSISGSSVDLSGVNVDGSGNPSPGRGSATRAALTVYSPDDGAEVREVVFPAMVNFDDDFERVLSTPSILEAPAVRHILTTHLCRNYQFVVPRPSDRACYPPSGFFTLYEDTLAAGLRFPLHPVFADLLNRVRIPIGQIAPNSFRQFVCLGVECRRNNVVFSADLILKFFQFKVCATGYYLSPRIGQGIRVKTPSKISGWQEKYFFCRIDDVPLYDWRRGSVDDVESDLSVDGGPLEHMGKVARKYSEAELAEVGLSPFVVGVDADPVTSQRFKLNVRKQGASKRTGSDAGVSSSSRGTKAPRTLLRTSAQHSEPRSSETPPSRAIAGVSAGPVVNISDGDRTPLASPPRTHAPQGVSSGPIVSLSTFSEAVAMHNAVGSFLTRGSSEIAQALRAKEEAERAKDEAEKNLAEVLDAKTSVEREFAKYRATADERAHRLVSEITGLTAERDAAMQELHQARLGQGPAFTAFFERIVCSALFPDVATNLANCLSLLAIDAALDDVAKDFPTLEKEKYADPPPLEMTRCSGPLRRWHRDG